MIYRFIKGIYSTYFADAVKLANTGRIDAYYQLMTTIANAIDQNHSTLTMTLDIRTVIITKEQIEEIEKITKLDIDDYDDVEEEEYKYVALYKTRKLAHRLLTGIEELFQELGHLDALQRYSRSNGLKRDTVLIKDTKPDITIKTALQSLIDQQELEMKGSKDWKFVEIKRLFINYVKLKNTWVVMYNPS